MKIKTVSLLTACLLVAPLLYAQDQPTSPAAQDQIASQITGEQPSKGVSKTLDQAGEDRVNLA